MVYEISRLRILVKTEEKEESLLYPTKYAIAAFDKEIDEDLPMDHKADEYHIIATSAPAVRSIDIDEIDMEIIYKTEDFSRFNRQRAEVARKFFSLFDGLTQCKSDCVPKDVAISRKSRPAVAMYLFAFKQYDYLNLAMEFDVSIEAVVKYRQRVLSDSFCGD